MRVVKLSDAITFVRKALDELNLNESQMFGTNDDDRNLEKMVELNMVEAVINIHRDAPYYLLEGVQKVVDYVTGDTDKSDATAKGIEYEDSGYSIVFSPSKIVDGVDSVLRLVSFKSKDSNVVLTKAFYEDSPEARMQNNPYTRGTWDAPVLIELANSENYTDGKDIAFNATGTDASAIYRGKAMKLKYCSMAKPYSFGFVITVFPHPYSSWNTNKMCLVSSRLYEQTLNELVGLVLASYRDSNAQLYLNMAMNNKTE